MITELPDSFYVSTKQPDRLLFEDDALFLSNNRFGDTTLASTVKAKGDRKIILKKEFTGG